MEGETVTFDCVAKGESTIVTWFREGIPISEIQVQKSLFFKFNYIYNIYNSIAFYQFLRYILIY